MVKLLRSKKNDKHKTVKVSTIFQLDAFECGAASLGMILEYYGIYIPLKQLRLDTRVNREGCKANTILHAARKYGLEAKGYKMSMRALFSTKAPCIIHWSYGHFLVYTGKKGEFVYLIDPSQGKRKMSIDEFSKGFSGIVLRFSPVENFVNSEKKRNIYELLKRRIKDQYKDILYLLLLGTGIMIPAIILLALQKYFIDGILNDNTSKALVIISIIFSMILVGVISIHCQNWLLNQLQNKKKLIFSYSFEEQIFKLPIFFYEQRLVRYLLGRLEEDDDSYELLLHNLLRSILNLLIIATYFCLLLVYNLKLASIVFFAVIVNIFLIKIYSSTITKNKEKSHKNQGKLQSMLYSVIKAILTLETLISENRYVSFSLGFCYKLLIGKGKEVIAQQNSRKISYIKMNICNLVVIIACYIEVYNGKIEISSVIAFITVFVIFIRSIKELLSYREEIQTIKEEINRVISQYEIISN